MTVSTRLREHTASIEPFDSLDGQGAPSYQASTDIKCRAVPTAEQTVDADGSDVRADLVAWVPSSEDVLPGVDDRITHDGTSYIVVNRMERRRLAGGLDHVKVEAVEE